MHYLQFIKDYHILSESQYFQNRCKYLSEQKLSTPMFEQNSTHLNTLSQALSLIHNTNQSAKFPTLLPPHQTIIHTLNTTSMPITRTMSYIAGNIDTHSRRNRMVWLDKQPPSMAIVQPLYLKGIHIHHLQSLEQLKPFLIDIFPRGVAVIVNISQCEQFEKNLMFLIQIYLQLGNFKQIFVIDEEYPFCRGKGNRRGQWIRQYPQIQFVKNFEQIPEKLNVSVPLLSMRKNPWVEQIKDKGEISSLQMRMNRLHLLSQVLESLKEYRYRGKKIINQLSGLIDPNIQNRHEAIAVLYFNYWQIKEILNQFMIADWDPLIFPAIELLLSDIYWSISRKTPTGHRLINACYEVSHPYISMSEIEWLQYNIGSFVSIDLFMRSDKNAFQSYLVVEHEYSDDCQSCEIYNRQGFINSGNWYKVVSVDEKEQSNQGISIFRIVLKCVRKEVAEEEERERNHEQCFVNLPRIKEKEHERRFSKSTNIHPLNKTNQRVLKLRMSANMSQIGASLLSRFLNQTLKQLKLSYCEIGDYGVSCLSRIALKQLNQIGLGCSNLSNAAIKFIRRSNWPKLANLQLYHNANDDVGMDELIHADFGSLQSLELHYTKIQNAGYLKMLAMSTKNLRQINLNSCNIHHLSKMRTVARKKNKRNIYFP